MAYPEDNIKSLVIDGKFFKLKGITSENYKQLKATDKEKAERLISYLDDLITNDLATPEQKTFWQNLSAHVVSMQSTTGSGALISLHSSNY
ncbi:46022_t:CDS:2 [Gigaspora margarita]|uniref:46022_t:CDS:1 n=1 Tax=Gigaspora margarita TaxID=4874 RepID=A0ABN7UFA1_GIGMA|nr:46022_t:CDS:2 [Gigaspora margarita]